ncbi:MAG: hypothetical protein GF383_09495 [Candidatus Lokiarchaeota archaeon]|nr:hypothetical protein [Candidatus Lokiarchaeota archaeon]MBD3340747.1 hypothetical protein [Candidatus Lokiarchaeota archaeon]
MGTLFLIYAIRNKFLNMGLLGCGFNSVLIGFVGNFLFRQGPVFQEIFVYIGYVLVVIFVNITFYRGHMKKAHIVLIAVIILGMIQIFLICTFSPLGLKRGVYYYFRISLDLIYVFLVFNWFAYSFYNAYNRLKDQDIEPWIKTRYKMLAIASFIMSFHTFPEFFQPKNVPWGDPSNPNSLIIFGTLAIMGMLYSVIFAISWLMPKSLKNYINKGYKIKIDEEYSEVELMNLIKKQLNKD